MDGTVFFVPLALLAGALLAVQASANLQLRTATGGALTASTLQLTVGTFALLAVAALAGALRVLDLLPAATWWHLLGGLGSAFYITSTILLFPRLGAVVSVGLFITGQMLASFALDTVGLLGVPVRPIGLGDTVGLLAVIGGAGLIVRAQGDAQARQQRSARQVGWILLAVVAGAALPVQGAVNALLHGDLGAPLAVGVVSFVVATIAMLLLMIPAITLGSEPGLRPGSLTRVPWWGWLGGICGAVYVTSVFTAMPVLGAAVVVGLTVAGQQIAAVLFDRFGLLRLPRRQVTMLRLGGVALLLSGVALSQVS
jgi:bacterial/archaeal transporter family-2 protein